MGAKPSGLSQSPLAVCTEMTSAAGSAQNKADSPRTSRRNEDSSAALRSISGMVTSDGEVSVVPETAFILVQPSHPFRGYHPIAFDRVIDLRFYLPRQIALVILHRGQRLHNGGAFDNFLD